MGRVFQPKLKSGATSRKWVIVYRANGHRVWENTGLTDEGAARRRLKEREAAATLGTPVLPRVDKMRFEEAAEDLRRHYEATGTRDLVEYTSRVQHLFRFFGGQRIATIDQPAVDRYTLARLGQGRTPSTVRRELGTLTRLLRLAYANNKLLRRPILHRPAEGPAREGFFERDQFVAVRAHLRPDLQVVATLAYTFGWREQEILRLERRQLDLGAGTLRLDPGGTKNKDGRVVYLTPECSRLLTEQLARVDALGKDRNAIIPCVFPHLQRGPRQGQPRRDFRGAWTRACEAAGVHGRLFHDLRRTAVRNMEQAGVPRSAAMKLTGHRSESVYRRYAIVSPSDLQDAARKLGREGAFSGAFLPAPGNPAGQVRSIKGARP